MDEGMAQSSMLTLNFFAAITIIIAILVLFVPVPTDAGFITCDSITKSDGKRIDCFYDTHDFASFCYRDIYATLIAHQWGGKEHAPLAVMTTKYIRVERFSMQKMQQIKGNQQLDHKTTLVTRFLNFVKEENGILHVEDLPIAPLPALASDMEELSFERLLNSANYQLDHLVQGLWTLPLGAPTTTTNRAQPLVDEAILSKIKLRNAGDTSETADGFAELLRRWMGELGLFRHQAQNPRNLVMGGGPFNGGEESFLPKSIDVRKEHYAHITYKEKELVVAFLEFQPTHLTINVDSQQKLSYYPTQPQQSSFQVVYHHLTGLFVDQMLVEAGKINEVKAALVHSFIKQLQNSRNTDAPTTAGTPAQKTQYPEGFFVLNPNQKELGEPEATLRRELTNFLVAEMGLKLKPFGDAILYYKLDGLPAPAGAKRH